MSPEQRHKIIRLAAIRLMRFDTPGAPAGAVGPPSRWWTQAEEVVHLIEPYFWEAFNEDL